MILFLPLLIFIGGLTAFFLNERKKLKRELFEREQLLSALHKLYTIMVSLVTLDETAQKLVDALAFEFGFRAGVLSLIDKKTNTIKRIAVSHTEAGLIGLKMLPVPYEQIGISLAYENNTLVKAIKMGKLQITQDMYNLFTPALDKELVNNLQRLMKIKTSFVYPIFSEQKPIGTMIFSIGGDANEISPFQREAIARVMEVVGLVIDRIYLYEELSQTSKDLAYANEKLQELDRLKDDFVSIASHELRTPMTAIRSYAWMALNRSDVPLSERLEKYLVRVLMSTERLINLVNDMLNISRIESGKIEINPEPVELIALIKDIVDEVYYSRSTEKKLQFIVLEKPTPKVFGDPEKLRQVLLNLVGNSLKFTPPGGKIIFDFFTDGKTVETSVKDTGVGISKADLGRLFQKFGRLDSSYVALSTSGGTGLGLYISKNLIELMHGKIWAESEGLGKGTTFTFSLPVASKDIVAHTDKFKIRPKGEVKGLEPVAI